MAHISSAAKTSTASVNYDDLVVAVGTHKDKAAFASLFAHFAPRIKGYMMRLGADASTADELAQEALLMVWRRAETFDPRQANATTWIFTIARNKRIDGIRREKKPELDPEEPSLLPSAPQAADERVEQDQASEQVAEAIKTLPPEQAELLRHAYFEDKPHSVIAAETGLPLGTVKSRLRLALIRLRKVIDAQ